MSRRFVASLLLLSVIVVTGCSRSSSMGVQMTYQPAAGDRFWYTITNRAGAPEEAISRLRQHLETELSSDELVAGLATVPPKTVTIELVSFQKPGAVGAFLARALEDSTDSSAGSLDPEGSMVSFVEVRDRRANAVVGSATVSSLSIRRHAARIVKHLKTGQL